MKTVNLCLLILSISSLSVAQSSKTKADTAHNFLEKLLFKKYVDRFNLNDKETIRNTIPNIEAWEWLQNNIPFFECPDKEIEEIYYFRWWTYRKHIKTTSRGYVITEFMPEVAHAKKYNTIICAAGLHIEEGRWIRNPEYINSYCKFWFSKEGERSDYSNWLITAIWDYCKTIGNYRLARDLLPAFIEDYKSREQQNLHSSGLFWSNENRDGGEYSISGNGLRPTLNGYQYGNANAIAEIALLDDKAFVSREFREKAEKIKHLVEEKLWDPSTDFFKTIHLQKKQDSVLNWDFPSIDQRFNVRELYGYIPWKFSLPGMKFKEAWRQVKDLKGFSAPYGLTTAEQRHPRFMKYRVKRCQWDGAVWPFATSLALKAMSNFIKENKQDILSKADFLSNLRTYARSQYRISAYGEKVPWIDENLHPYNGNWLARSIIFELNDPVVGSDLTHGFERGKDYNHSSYADLIISDLFGLKSRADEIIEIDPLITGKEWEYFCLENVLYHGYNLTILYDKTGKKYGQGKGFCIYINGKLVERYATVRKVVIERNQIPALPVMQIK